MDSMFLCDDEPKFLVTDERVNILFVGFGKERVAMRQKDGDYVQPENGPVD